MIPSLLLEEILLGEKDAKDYYEKYGRDEIENALAELRKSNQEILAAYPEPNFNPRIVRAEEKPRTSFIVRMNRSKPFMFAAAAVLALAVCVPMLKNAGRMPGNNPYIGVKGSGHHQIRLYRQNGTEAVLLNNGDAAKERDLVQITYTPASYRYGVIFSVDGNGNVTRHFPDASWKAAKLEKTGEEVPLSFSYELDDAPKYECFVFVASKEPFDFSGIEKIDGKSMSPDFLKKGSYLPKGCDGTIFVLNKE